MQPKPSVSRAFYVSPYTRTDSGTVITGNVIKTTAEHALVVWESGRTEKVSFTKPYGVSFTN